MSSHYVLFCMSHDPPIVFGGASDWRDWNSPEPALAAMADRTVYPMRDHPDCALLVGRYSGALIEVGCPPQKHPGGTWHPHSAEWVDAEWLRLLAVSTPEQLTTAQWPQRCWTRDLAWRLRYLLDLDLPATHGEQP